MCRRSNAIRPLRKTMQPIRPIAAELIKETWAQAAVIDTQPASSAPAAALKSNLFVSSCLLTDIISGLRTIVARQAVEPLIMVVIITLSGPPF